MERLNFLLDSKGDFSSKRLWGQAICLINDEKK
jgi:hypothetical protein